jgi:hypothetical protein
MPTLHCTVCLRRWREGGPYACTCLDTSEPPAKNAPVWVYVEAPPVLPGLVVLLLLVGLGGVAVWWVVWWSVRGVLRLLGVWP